MSSRLVTAAHRTVGRDAGKPTLSFLIRLGLAVASLNAVLLANAILIISLKAAAIDAQAATTVLSIVVGIGSVFALVAYPLFGRLSDRTLSRFGRRRPYILTSAVLLAIGAAVTVAAADVLTLTIGWILTTLGVVVGLVSCSALVPDQILPEHRGLPSAMLGLGAPVGALLGLFLAQAVQPNIAAMIWLPTGVAIIAVLILGLTVSDRQITSEERPPLSVRQFLGTFWVNPITHRDFGFAWGSRFMIFMGVAAVNAYQAFYLIIVLHIDPATVGTAIFVGSILSTGLALVFAPLLAKLSDRVQRRKPFVIASALVFAVGLGITAVADNYALFLVAVSVMGLGQGVYFAVDYALVMDVLPDPENPAKDLGIMNLASSLPATVVPTIAPVLLAIGASAVVPQNFSALFLAGTIAALIGALLILPIRSVK